MVKSSRRSRRSRPSRPSRPSLPSRPSRPSRSSDASLLDDLTELFNRYVVFPSETTRDAVVLWAAHSHVYEAFDTTPRLILVSPTRECGKTTVLNVLKIVCARPAVHAGLIGGVKGLLQTINEEDQEKKVTTLLLDEATGALRGDVVDALSSGYKVGAQVVVMRGTRAVTLETFAPVAIAGTGRPDDLDRSLTSRSIIVAMQRRPSERRIEQLSLRTPPDDALAIQVRLSKWSAEAREILKIAKPDLPDSTVDRAGEIWRPLCAIADDFGGLWPERARKAADAIEERRIEMEPTKDERLLADCHFILLRSKEAQHGVCMESATLVEILKSLKDSEWSRERLNQTSLARALHSFDVWSKNVRVPGKPQRKGYYFSDIDCAYKTHNSNRANNLDRDTPRDLRESKLPLEDFQTLPL